MHDPMTVAFDIPSYKARQRWPWLPYLLTIWHVDPERDGSDDSCGWFMRCRHGDRKVLDRIVRRFDFDWDRTFDPNRRDPDDSDYGGDAWSRRPLVYTGLFRPEDGQPNLSPVAITVNLFHHAAGIHFDRTGDGFNWHAAERFMRRHLAEIIRFAENPTDSLVEDITRRFEVNCGESYRPDKRAERIRHFASIIYAWILRADRPWWRHPRWHVHHWHLQIHPLQSLRRWLFTRCEKCGGRFRHGDSAVSGCWQDPPRRWFESFRGERGLSHSKCVCVNVVAGEQAGSP